MPRNAIALDNLSRAFPDKTEAQCRAIRRNMWDQLFRTAAEGASIDRYCDFDPQTGLGQYMTVRGGEHAIALRNDGKAGLVFTAHIGNWELLPAAAAKIGLDISSLYRPPNIAAFAALIERTRARNVGALVPSRPGAAFALASILAKGGHVGVLVDQKFISRSRVQVKFFGRPANASPLLAKLARNFDCPVHGARMIRQSGGRHLLEITGPIELPRDQAGRVDVAGATQMIASVVEGWVREHPEQWLWVHRRWQI